MAGRLSLLHNNYKIYFHQYYMPTSNKLASLFQGIGPSTKFLKPSSHSNWSVCSHNGNHWTCKRNEILSKWPGYCRYWIDVKNCNTVTRSTSLVPVHYQTAHPNFAEKSQKLCIVHHEKPVSNELNWKAITQRKSNEKSEEKEEEEKTAKLLYIQIVLNFLFTPKKNKIK